MTVKREWLVMLKISSLLKSIKSVKIMKYARKVKTVFYPEVGMSCLASRNKMINVGSGKMDSVPKQIITNIDCTVSSSSLTSEVYLLTMEFLASKYCF